MKLFDGYYENDRVTVSLEDNHVVCFNHSTGETTGWNEQEYTEEDRALIRFSMLNDGFRFA